MARAALPAFPTLAVAHGWADVHQGGASVKPRISLFFPVYKDEATVARVAHKSLALLAEVAIKTMLKGFRVGEVGIQTFPRQLGRGSSVSMANIIATIKDMMRVRRTVFSSEYDRPMNR